MDLIADGFLITASLVAAFYCWAINRRLKALKRHGSGLAEQFEAFGKNVEKAHATITRSRETAEAEKERVEALLQEADAMRKEIRRAQTELMRERARKVDAMETLQKYIRRDSGAQEADEAARSA